MEYPALYNSADRGSASAQGLYLWTIRLEYGLLFAISVMVAYGGAQNASRITITAILVILGGLFVFKSVKELLQDWYRCRALAESIKTSTWRFAMRAHPFNDAKSIQEPLANFRNLLNEILRANASLAKSFTAVGTDQVTEGMLRVRALPLEQRLEYYNTHRVSNQRLWYVKKAKANRVANQRWIFTTILIYISAVIFLNAPPAGVKLSWLFDPSIVLVTSIIGWMQMKRYSELSASYTLTAHEIGIIASNINGIKDEDAWSDFVNEAELAFSREHTQWVARRDVN